MKDLLKTDFEKLYSDYIKRQISISDVDLKSDFLKLLQIDNPKERLKYWSEMKVLITRFNETFHLANPYFLGYGNPDANILFLGKEKAFNIHSNPELFIHESVNNTLQWRKIYLDKKINYADRKYKLGFDPMFPKSYFTKKFHPRHTWGIYATIVQGLNNGIQYLLNSTNYETSFFSQCFLSEINHIPSNYSENRKLTEERKRKILQNDFFQKFGIVIIGAKGYLDDSEIKDIFEVDKGIGRRLDTKEAMLYKNKKGQKIIYCNQLSGAAGWTKKGIDALIQVLKELN